MPDCIFCKIAAKQIPSKTVYEDEYCYGFYDIDPKAPIHFLIIPKEHIGGIGDINEGNCGVVARLLMAAVSTAEKIGLDNGYRIVTNYGEDGGQTVPHLHFHVLGGRALSWPPG